MPVVLGGCFWLKAAGSYAMDKAAQNTVGGINTCDQSLSGAQRGPMGIGAACGSPTHCAYSSQCLGKYGPSPHSGLFPTCS